MKKFDNGPHVKRGWLRNGNKPGDLSKAAKCGALTRKKSSCRSPAMKNGRCRLHGGKSTGPKTAKGKAKSAKANLKHGYYTVNSREILKEIQKVMSKEFVNNLLKKDSL